jgi:hypothetical protein
MRPLVRLWRLPEALRLWQESFDGWEGSAWTSDSFNASGIELTAALYAQIVEALQYSQKNLFD